MTPFSFATLTLVWLGAVMWAAGSGTLARLPLPALALGVVAGIVLPMLAWMLSPPLQRWTERLGQRRLMLLHTWRIAAALVFFGYGLAGQLPPIFWVPAGVGDLAVGLLALREARRPPTPQRHARFHRLGLADFVVAVGTGLTLTLMGDPRMAALAALPLALIPLFGVGLSGAGHLVALALLRRDQAHRAATPGADYLVP